MMRSFLRIGPVGLLVVLALGAVPAQADLRLPAVFGDNMVLQRDMTVPVWGWAKPGGSVTVSIAGQSQTATADAGGRWMVKLSPLHVGPPLEMVVREDRQSLTLKNILVGEVWLCSGQSNMYLGVRFFANAAKEIQAANHPDLRLFSVQGTGSDTPQTDCHGHWVPCSPQVIPDFSATAYYFGRDLQQALGVPVGIICSAWNGAYIESWLSLPALKTDPDYPIMEARWEKALAHAPAAMAEYRKKLAAYKIALAQARQDKKPLPRAPYPPYTTPTPEEDQGIIDQTVEHYPIAHPAALFNGLIAPLIPTAIRGIVWYQGESNFYRAVQYGRLLPLLIRDWRSRWGEGDLPFIYVQIPNMGRYNVKPPPPPGQDWWAELRDAQRAGLAEPRTAMVVTTDLGNGDIHPTNKQGVGARLELTALGMVYGKSVVYRSPMYASWQVKGHQACVTFDTYGSTLQTTDQGPVTGFAIAGADQKFIWAHAEIDGPCVRVWSDKVPQPAAVRYGWSAAGNLVNAAGLPASPFRTDDWPVLSSKNR